MTRPKRKTVPKVWRVWVGMANESPGIHPGLARARCIAVYPTRKEGLKHYKSVRRGQLTFFQKKTKPSVDQLIKARVYEMEKEIWGFPLNEQLGQ